MSILIFWVVPSYGLVDRYQCFGGTYCLHFQGSYFSPEDGGSMFLGNVVHKELQPRQTWTEVECVWEQSTENNIWPWDAITSKLKKKCVTRNSTQYSWRQHFCWETLWKEATWEICAREGRYRNVRMCKVNLPLYLSTTLWRRIGNVKVKLHALHKMEVVASFAHSGKESLVPLGRRLGAVCLVAKNKISSLAGNRTSAIQLIASHFTGAILALNIRI
jgi:ferredoxin